MSEFKQELQKLIVKEVENRSSSFVGIVTDYDHKSRTCTVEISNPTGAGKISLSNRPVPETPKGLIPGGIRIGSVALMTCPMGQYTHAEIAAIKPPGEVFGLPDRVEQDQLPRSSKSIGLNSRLRA